MNPLVQGSKIVLDLASYWGEVVRLSARGDWDGLAVHRYCRFLSKVNLCCGPMYVPDPTTLRRWASKITLPVMLEGLGGDAKAQRRYEQIAPISFSSLPEWGKQRIDSLVHSLVSHAPFDTRFSLDNGRSVKIGISSRAELIKGLRSSSYKALWLAAFSTFSDAQSLVARFDELPTKDHVPKEDLTRVLAIEDEQRQQEELWNLCGLSPTSHGPIAIATRQFMRAAVPLMFKIRVLDDILNNHELTLTKEGYSTLLSAGATAWELASSREVRNLLQAVAFIDEQGGECSAAARSRAVEAAIRSKSPLRSVRQVLGIPEPTNGQSSSVAAEPELPTKEIVALSARQVILEKLPTLSGVQERRVVARKLAKLYAHGHCTLNQISEGLEKKIDPEDLLEQLYLNSTLQRLPESALRRVQAIPEAKSDSGKSSVAEYGLVLHRTQPFDEWLGSLEKRSVALVEARLYRVSEGNMGDRRHLDSNLFELRIHVGSGIRIYLAQTGKNEWLVLHGGVKQTQDDDIQRALAMLQ